MVSVSPDRAPGRRACRLHDAARIGRDQDRSFADRSDGQGLASRNDSLHLEPGTAHCADRADRRAHRPWPRLSRSIAEGSGSKAQRWQVFHLNSFRPSVSSFSGDVEQVDVPGRRGRLRRSRRARAVRLDAASGRAHDPWSGGTKRSFVREGFAEVNAKGLTVLAETAVPGRRKSIAKRWRPPSRRRSSSFPTPRKEARGKRWSGRAAEGSGREIGQAPPAAH